MDAPLHCNHACNSRPALPAAFPTRCAPPSSLVEWTEWWQLPALKHLAITGIIAHHDGAWITMLLRNNGGQVETFTDRVSEPYWTDFGLEGTRRTHAPDRL